LRTQPFASLDVGLVASCSAIAVDFAPWRHRNASLYAPVVRHGQLLTRQFLLMDCCEHQRYPMLSAELVYILVGASCSLCEISGDRVQHPSTRAINSTNTNFTQWNVAPLLVTLHCLVANDRSGFGRGYVLPPAGRPCTQTEPHRREIFGSCGSASRSIRRAGWWIFFVRRSAFWRTRSTSPAVSCSRESRRAGVQASKATIQGAELRGTGYLGPLHTLHGP